MIQNMFHSIRHYQDLESYFDASPTVVSLVDPNNTAPELTNDECEYNVGVGIIQNLNNMRMQGPLNNTKSHELASNREEWDKKHGLGFKIKIIFWNNFM